MDHINSSIYICSKKGYEKQVSWIASRGAGRKVRNAHAGVRRKHSREKAMRKTCKLKGEAFQGCDNEPIPAF